MGYQIQAIFKITLHEKDFDLLCKIQNYFGKAPGVAVGDHWGHGDPSPPLAKQVAGHPVGYNNFHCTPCKANIATVTLSTHPRTPKKGGTG